MNSQINGYYQHSSRDVNEIVKELKEDPNIDELGYFDTKKNQWVCTGFVTDRWKKILFKEPIRRGKTELDLAIDQITRELENGNIKR